MPRDRRTWLAIVLGVIGLLILWNVRPVFHGFVLFFWTAPIVWFPPLLILGAGLLLTRLRTAEPPSQDPDAPSGRPTDPRLDTVSSRRGWRRRLRPIEWIGMDELPRPGRTMIVTLSAAFVAFVLGAAANGPLVSRAIYNATDYAEIPGLPSGGTVRLVPKDVAEQIASSGFNSSTERLTDFHVVRTSGGLRWTAIRSPNGIFRVLAKKSQGIVTLDASSSERRVTESDAEFETSPRVQITDNLRWRLLKRRYLIQLTEPVGILGADGTPLIMVPYLKYKGLLIRRPVFGGVFVVHPDGDIEDLDPGEARERPELRDSGRLFPEELARRLHDAYAYKKGIWNRFFVHEEQTHVSDTESNRQPYLIDFDDRGAKWVTVAEPYGRAFAVNAIFLTDTVTGRTQIWRVPKSASLSGNRRVLQTVRSVSIPGVVFAEEGGETEGGGRFRVVEPRPVFVDGRLVFLVSVIPEQANSVSKSVIVDAARNKVIAIFDNDTDPDADAKVARYLATGALRAEDRTAPEQGGATGAKGPTGAAGSTGASGPTGPERQLTPAELRRRLETLAERQRDLLREVEELRRAVGDGGVNGAATGATG